MFDFLVEFFIFVYIDFVDDVFFGVEVWYVYIIFEFFFVYDYGVMLFISNKGDI